MDLTEELLLSHDNWIGYTLILNEPNLMKTNLATFTEISASD